MNFHPNLSNSFSGLIIRLEWSLDIQHADLFCRNKSTCNTRQTQPTYGESFCRNNRFYNSPLYFLTRLLNKNPIKKWLTHYNTSNWRSNISAIHTHYSYTHRIWYNLHLSWYVSSGQWVCHCPYFIVLFIIALRWTISNSTIVLSNKTRLLLSN